MKDLNMHKDDVYKEFAGHTVYFYLEGNKLNANIVHGALYESNDEIECPHCQNLAKHSASPHLRFAENEWTFRCSSCKKTFRADPGSVITAAPHGRLISGDETIIAA